MNLKKISDGVYVRRIDLSEFTKIVGPDPSRMKYGTVYGEVSCERFRNMTPEQFSKECFNVDFKQAAITTIGFDRLPENASVFDVTIKVINGPHKDNVIKGLENGTLTFGYRGLIRPLKELEIITFDLIKHG
jgi:hypothetical protein